MILGMRTALAASVVLALSGCMIARQPAPVVERSPEPVRKTTPSEARPGTYIVKRGDTLYAIALAHGIDYRDLARWNAITNPAAIEVGQVLLVKDPNAAPPPAVAAPAVVPAPGAAVVAPYQAPPPVHGQPMGPDGVAIAPPSGAQSAPGAPEPPPAGLITTPQAVKLPYSQAALAQLQEATSAAPSAPAASAPAAPAEKEQAKAAGDDPDSVAWGWPTKGKVIAGFNENGGPKGVQIAGNLGQAILASAPGRVVYTGSGLRGYGNLVIIKHNETYLSAYAHNRSVLVKQGDSVAKGQKIAEMGDSDASRVMLHFEIRRLGKPVDPIKFLPPT
jgi:lipoprotein NlpD